MAETQNKSRGSRDVDSLVEQLRRARQWSWRVLDHRVPGVARDLSWALIELARDHDPDTYSPWLQADALECEHLIKVLDLAAEIAGLIRKADRLQPHLIRSGEAGQ